MVSGLYYQSMHAAFLVVLREPRLLAVQRFVGGDDSLITMKKKTKRKTTKTTETFNSNFSFHCSRPKP